MASPDAQRRRQKPATLAIVATPTERLIRRVAHQLGEPVTVAVRVRESRRRWQIVNRLVPGLDLLAGQLGPGPIVRRAGWRVLAFTASGERMLLDVPRRFNDPTARVERLRRDGEISGNATEMEERLADPVLTVDGRPFMVHSLDWGVFLKRVMNDEIDAPLIKRDFVRLARKRNPRLADEPAFARKDYERDWTSG